MENDNTVYQKQPVKPPYIEPSSNGAEQPLVGEVHVDIDKPIGDIAQPTFWKRDGFVLLDEVGVEEEAVTSENQCED